MICGQERQRRHELQEMVVLLESLQRLETEMPTPFNISIEQDLEPQTEMPTPFNPCF